MDFFNETLKEKTGSGRFKSSMHGFYLKSKHDFNKFFTRSKHGRLRAGLAVLTLAGLITYGLKKDVVDSHLEKLRKNYVERAEHNKLIREEKRAQALVSTAKNKYDSLKDNIAYLSFKEDSLNKVVQNLSYSVSSSSKHAVHELEKLNSQVMKLYATRDSLEKVTNAASFKTQELHDQRVKSTTKNVVNEKIDSSANLGDGSRSFNSYYVWVSVPPKSSISEIAREYYGDASRFREIAELNNIHNPNFVLRNQPLTLVASSLVNTQGVMSGLAPDYIQVKKRETLDDFLNRIKINVSVNDVLDYNKINGNNIKSDALLINTTDVVYLKDDWLK